MSTAQADWHDKLGISDRETLRPFEWSPLYPFAVKLAEAMCRVKPDVWEFGRAGRIRCFDWTQVDHTALLNRRKNG